MSVAEIVSITEVLHTALYAANIAEQKQRFALKKTIFAATEKGEIMSRQALVNDIPAQICWKYLHGGYSQKTNEEIYEIFHCVIHDRNIAVPMMVDIAYRIGYAKSALIDRMSESTYKIKKKQIRDMLVSVPIIERSENV